MKQFLLKIFTWWNGQTFGTQLWTARFGELVGEDEQGNRYYRTKGGEIDPTLNFERRWVVYNGYAEATRIPPGWHSWIHHTTDVPPTEQNYAPREWEKPHVPNMTGTPQRLPSVRLDAGERPPAQGHRRLPGLDARKLISGIAVSQRVREDTSHASAASQASLWHRKRACGIARAPVASQASL